jgi:hypothetical protein
MTDAGYNLRPGVRVAGIEECLKDLKSKRLRRSSKSSENAPPDPADVKRQTLLP